MKYSQAVLAGLLAGVVAGCSTLPTGYSSRSSSSLEDLFTSDENVIASNETKAAAVEDTGLRIRKSERGNMKSYVVRGQRYHTMAESDGYSARGLASWYGPNFHGQTASNGETYDMYKMTAAHKTLPLPTYARVSHIDSGKSVIVKINDRGPFSGDRLIDLSFAAALQLGMVNDGTAMVDIEALTAQEVAELSGPDNKWNVDFYTDESVRVALETEATDTAPVLAAVQGSESVELQPLAQAEQQGVIAAVQAATETDADGGELLSLDSLESELAAADSATINTNRVTSGASDTATNMATKAVANEEIKVLVNAEATTEVRKAAGLPVDLIENASAAGQPVSLTSIGAVQTTKAVDETAALEQAVAQTDQGGVAVAVPNTLQAVDSTAGAAAATAEANRPGYYIQAGVFANVKDAEKVAVEAVLAVPLEEVHVKPLKGSEMYRITVGPIIAADHAAEVSGKLDDAGVDNFTVKVKSIQ